MLAALVIAGPAFADSVIRCNESGDTCVVRRIPTEGTFQQPIQDELPDEYPPGYLHSGLYCVQGLWHRGWLKPGERSPVIRPSCGSAFYQIK
jgi:hypothetical protein